MKIMVGRRGVARSVSCAVIAIPLLLVTYDELLFIPLRLVIFIMYCCFWTAVRTLITEVITRRRGLGSPARSIVAGVVLGLALAGLAEFLRRGILPTQLLALTAGTCGLGGLFLPHRRDQRSPPGPEELPIVLPGLAVVVTLAIVTTAPGPSFVGVLTNQAVSLTPERVLRDVYARYLATDLAGRTAGCRRDQAELLNRRIEFEACAPPVEVVQRLYSLLPKTGVLLLNPMGDFLGTGLLPVRLAAPVRPDHGYRDWTVQLPRFRQIVQRTLDEYRGMPFFASGESPEQRYLDARELGATHVLADPMSREAVVVAVAARPDLFVELMDESGWLLVGVAQTAQTQPR